MKKLLFAFLMVFISIAYAKDKEREVVGVSSSGMDTGGIYIVDGYQVFYCSNNNRSCRLISVNYKEELGNIKKYDPKTGEIK